MVQIVGLDCPCVYREVTLQVNEVTAKCGMQEYSPPPGVSEHPEYILVLCQDEIGSYSLSHLLFRFQWEGHQAVWSEKKRAKHLNQHPCPDVRRSVLRITPWKCLRHGLYETFTDLWGRRMFNHVVYKLNEGSC